MREKLDNKSGTSGEYHLDKLDESAYSGVVIGYLIGEM